ncbi:MAG: hypothetical protein ACJ8KA_13660 [Sulfurifustis sp.]
MNYHVSFWQALLSAATQFGLSFFATSTLAFAMSAILALGRSPLYFAAAVIVPLNLLAAVFALAHWLAGTPHIVATIAPSYLLGLVFCVVYSTNAIRQRGALTATLSRD